MGLDRWLEAVGIDPKWFRRAAAKQRAARIFSDLPEPGGRGDRSPAAGGKPAAPLIGRYAASDGKGDGPAGEEDRRRPSTLGIVATPPCGENGWARAGGDQLGLGSNRFAPVAREAYTRLPLSIALKGKQRPVDQSDVARPVPRLCFPLSVVK